MFLFPQACSHKAIFIFLSLILYAIFSSPTPEHLGEIEIAIGLFLILSVGFMPAFKVFTGWALFNKNGRSFKLAMLSFLYLLYIPLAIGLVNNNQSADIIRDVIPLFYLFLPILIIYDAKEGRDHLERAFLWGAVAIGVLYGLRFLVIMDMPLHKIGEERGDDGLLYLASEPCVLFAALYLPIRALSRKPIKSSDRYNFLIRGGMLAGGLVAALSLAATIQRAPVIFILVILSVYVFTHARHDVRMLFSFVVVLLLMLFTFHEPVFGLFNLIVLKTLEVGDNARLDEIRAVIDTIRINGFDVFWGRGWGSLVMSPAAGHVWVRYTHVLWSYALLKSGVVGILFLFAYFVFMVPKGWRLMWRDPILFFSLAPPLFMGVFLTPSFKMLGFGVLLSLLVFKAQSDTINTHSNL